MKKEKRFFLSSGADEATDFIPMITEGGDNFEFKEGENDDIPILALRNMVLFPEVVLPVALGRKKSLLAVKNAYKNNGVLGVFAQKNENEENPEIGDLFGIGTVANVLKILELPDGSTTAILQGRKRIGLRSLDTTGHQFYRGAVAMLPETFPIRAERKEFDALVSAVKETAIKIVKGSSNMHPEAVFAIRNIESTSSLINFVAANFNFSLNEKQSMLNLDKMAERGYSLLTLLNKELQMVEIKLSIQSRAQEGIDQQQKEYFLQQQIRAIQDELGDSSSEDIHKLCERAKEKNWSQEVQAIFEHEIHRLERLNTNSPDYSVQLNYLETMVDLPWGVYSKDSLNIKKAQKILERDHFGMEKVKERIIEHLAVMKLRKEQKAPILCLYGPPGVGKTSLGKSIAEALNRKYVRISLGGLHDEAEIRGHRRTYIGAMPGRIIQSLKKAETSNPVFILDEIDKVSSDFKGDPSSALLEVLDPEQNSAFHDNFLDVDYDLSRVMFIATANSLDTISKPLLDRMEIIEVGGYITEEKVRIAADHLIPRERENHGLTPEDVTLSPQTIEKIIESYTRESGVRELDKQIAKVMRKVAYKYATKTECDPLITPENLEEYLGVERFSRDKYQGNDYAGVVTGLAWTAVGGEILFVETSLCKSKTPKLTLTGNLGDVMKESASLALEYIRAHAEQWNIDPLVFEEKSIHVHVPEGATPKDGPSAGVTMVTSITSALTGRKVRPNLAMTGEIILRGKVLPVGGIREKILAAKRAGIKEIILCKENMKDIAEIKESYLKGLTFHYVEDIKEVLEHALLEERAIGF